MPAQLSVIEKLARRAGPARGRAVRRVVNRLERLGVLPALREEPVPQGLVRQIDKLAAVAPLAELPEQRAVQPPPLKVGPVTARFHAQLEGWQPDVERLDEATRAAWETADPRVRPYLEVMLAVWQDAPGFCERTGLSPVEPPEDVHAMARGPLAAGGGFNAADVVTTAVEEAGGDLSTIQRALDFGGSSGRVVRVLRAAFTQAEWHSCDPNRRAVEWAHEHLPGITFSVSPLTPPTAFHNAMFDLVYAISVWSHFAEHAALAWFEEMHRILRPGGLFVVSTQGWHATRHFAVEDWWDEPDVLDAIGDLYRYGHHFRAIFGEDGDFGVRSPSWGMAFLSPEWLARHLTPRWEIAYYRPGAIEGNQDVYTLRRR